MNTELILGTAATDLVALFKPGSDQIDPILARIAAEVRAHVPDLTTAKGRDAIASLAYKVSKSKTALDDAGKSMTEVQKKEIAQVDAARKKIRDSLDALRDEARKPLTDWEAAEAARKERIKSTLHSLQNHGMTGMELPDEIKAAAEIIKAIVIGDDFAEAADIAKSAQDASLNTLRGLYAAAVKREQDAEELAKLRAEAEARAIADAERAEQQYEAQRKAEAEAAEAKAATEREAARLAQIEADATAAKLAAEQAEAKRKADAKAAEEARDAAVKKALEDAAAKAEADAQAERARVKAAADAEALENLRRAADKDHRAKIKADIVAALSGMAGRATPDAIADALMNDEIPHCKVTL